LQLWAYEEYRAPRAPVFHLLAPPVAACIDQAATKRVQGGGALLAAVHPSAPQSAAAQASWSLCGLVLPAALPILSVHFILKLLVPNGRKGWHGQQGRRHCGQEPRCALGRRLQQRRAGTPRGLPPNPAHPPWLCSPAHGRQHRQQRQGRARRRCSAADAQAARAAAGPLGGSHLERAAHGVQGDAHRGSDQLCLVRDLCHRSGSPHHS
jgi:hypothetical protein